MVAWLRYATPLKMGLLLHETEIICRVMLLTVTNCFRLTKFSDLVLFCFSFVADVE